MSEPNGPAPLAVTFMAMEPKGAIAKYEWDFKDNSAVMNGPSVEHTFNEPGQYTVTLTVKDATGNFNRAAVMVSVNEGGTCAQVPADFSATVWPAMSTTCTSCHMPGKAAFGTNLVFVAGGTELQEYNVLRAYAKTSSDVLLAKVIGGLNHTGGAPFGNAQSAQYKALSDLVPVMKTPCTSGSDAPVATQFWEGVSFNDDQTKLAKGAILFAGRNPTAAEASAVTTGGAPVLRQTLRSYMTGPAFDKFLDEAGEYTFLSRGVVVFGNNMGLNATDLPSAADVINNTNLAAGVRNRFQLAMQREPVELMKYIVNTRQAVDRHGRRQVHGREPAAGAVPDGERHRSVHGDCYRSRQRHGVPAGDAAEPASGGRPRAYGRRFVARLAEPQPDDGHEPQSPPRLCPGQAVPRHGRRGARYASD